MTRETAPPPQHYAAVAYGRQIAAPTDDRAAGGLPLRPAGFPLEGKLAAEFKRRLTDEVSKL